MRIALALLLLSLPALAHAQDTAPKVAVVVAGDADPPLRDAARRLEDALAVDGIGVRLPADPGLRDALLGDTAPAVDDGLGPVRALRRRLGRSEAEDLPSLLELARITGCVALVVVRVPLGGTGFEAVVLAVAAHEFFVGGVDPSTTEPAALQRFVTSRAREAAATHAAAAATAPPAAPTTTAAPPATTEVSPTHVPSPPTGGATGHVPPLQPSPSPGHGAGGNGAHPPEDLGQWLSRNWVFVLVGALVAGAAIGLIVASQPSEAGPPVLRFE